VYHSFGQLKESLLLSQNEILQNLSWLMMSMTHQWYWRVTAQWFLWHCRVITVHWFWWHCLICVNFTQRCCWYRWVLTQIVSGTTSQQKDIITHLIFEKVDYKDWGWTDSWKNTKMWSLSIVSLMRILFLKIPLASQPFAKQIPQAISKQLKRSNYI
jgi:hypothetical protein